jgi:hypothetical protein
MIAHADTAILAPPAGKAQVRSVVSAAVVARSAGIRCIAALGHYFPFPRFPTAA